MSIYQYTERKKQLKWIIKTVTPINIREKNLMSRQQQHNCFNKNDTYIHLLKSFLTLIAKEFLFLSLLETETFFGIMIFWVGGRNCTMKNEKCIFPKLWYVNLNTVLANQNNNDTGFTYKYFSFYYLVLS